MRNLKTFSILVFSVFLLHLFSNYKIAEVSPVKAETETEKFERLSKEIKEYEAEIARLKSQASTLSNQIAQFDAQIRLTALKINQTEDKIFLLNGRINQLESSLQNLSKAFTSRVVKTYKMTKLNEPYALLISSPDLNTAVTSFHYLQKIQASDRDLMVRLEKAQTTYVDEKEDQEKLHVQLEEQKKVLATQKLAKANLLEQTRNDEKKYQELLANSKAEYEAIQAIVAGKGEETEVGSVSAGQKIATIIQGSSCNSLGTHLHFMVRKPGGVTENPFKYLKPGISFEDNSGGDSFNPSGSWEWPIRPTVKFNQGYGSDTQAIRSKVVWYSFHNGIDINSNASSDVLTVANGTLYRGSYLGIGNCRLRYVRVDHSDSDLDTLYLHINY